ncbi:MAG: hypothetical protein IKG18_03975 [Atopobiaceae bacterium]|nr:hypothetical protein [Atopobiaceae bacterium]MBR3313277.1 hypothetical protein [Atopobiaceae bacterium]
MVEEKDVRVGRTVGERLLGDLEAAPGEIATHGADGLIPSSSGAISAGMVLVSGLAMALLVMATSSVSWGHVAPSKAQGQGREGRACALGGRGAAGAGLSLVGEREEVLAPMPGCAEGGA